MDFDFIELADEKQILELYDDIISFGEQNLISGCLHYIVCDNGKSGYFCLRGVSRCGVYQEKYACEDVSTYPVERQCTTWGSLGCFCGTGNQCGYFKKEDTSSSC